jgi:signal transduction histidine kinase
MEKSRFESSLSHLPEGFLWQLFFAAAIFASNLLGWHFRSPLGGFELSAVWPGAGVAIALCMLFGKRAIYGILLGNLLFELHSPLRETSNTWFTASSSIILAIAQTSGAYLGQFLLRKFSYKGIFHSVRDASVFLLLAGVVSSLIVPTVITTLLSFEPAFHWGSSFPQWFRVFISNVSGVFIFASVLIVWGRSQNWNLRSALTLQTALFLIIYGVITYLASEKRFGLIYLYLPLLIWIAFSLGELGSTLALLIFSLTSLLLADKSDLAFVIAFVDVVTATILILQGVITEIQSSQQELKDYSENLENKILFFSKEKDRKEEKNTQSAIANALSVGIAHQLQTPVSKIVEYSGGADTCAELIYQDFQRSKPSFSGDTFNTLEANFKTLQTCLKSIKDGSVQAAHLLKIMNQQTIRERTGKKEFKPVDLHALINSSLGRNLAKQSILDPHFKVNIIKNFSEKVPRINAISGDLDQTFYHLFDNAIYAMKEKFDRGEKDYTPQLVITTTDRGDFVEIVIEDNGIGIPPEALFKIFQPFYTTKPSGAFSGIGLSIAFEITEKEHQGKIEIDSNEGRFTKVKIELPKNLL